MVTPDSQPRRLNVDAALLKRFAGGELPPLVEDKVAAYVEQRPRLLEQAVSLSGDRFLARLKAVRQRSLPALDPAQQPTADPQLIPAVMVTDRLSSEPSSLQEVPAELSSYPAYRLVKELGRGGMGVVYLAKNLQMDRLEVLKVLSERLLDHAGAKERFLREVRAVSKLNHPNIVTSYSILPLNTLLVFVMEYVHGMDLHKFIHQHQPVPIGLACFFAKQIAAGLQHAHEKGLVHRDIKPANAIIYKADGQLQLKILDFGLAKATSEKMVSGLTQDGMMLGTPEYMSPEQTLNAAQADIRADIYSLGCTLYCMLTGQPPFRGTHGEVLMAHAQRDAVPVNVLRPEVPLELAALVAKLMAKSVGKRSQTPGEVVSALAPFVGNHTLAKKREQASQVTTGTVFDLAASDRETSVEAPLPSLSLDTGSRLVDSQSQLDAISNRMGDQRRGVTHTVRRRGQKTTNTKFQISPKFQVPFWLGILLSIFGALWLGGVFTFRTPDGSIIIEHAPEGADFLFDGKHLEVVWNEGQDRAVVQLAAGEHKVDVLFNGVRVAGEVVTVIGGKATKMVVAFVPPTEDKDQQSTDADIPVAAEETAGAENPAEIASLPVAPRYLPLWNGKNFDGWSFAPSANGTWQIRNDYLMGSGAIDELKTDRNDYQYFDLTCDVALYDGAIGALRFGGSDTRFISCKLMLDELGDVLLFSPTEVNFHRLPSATKVALRDGEWFQFRTRITPDFLTLYVNGNQVNEVSSKGLDKLNAISLAKWGSRGEVKFRNLQIVEIPTGQQPNVPTGVEQLFNGRDLTGWKGDSRFWSVAGGTIAGKSTAANILDVNTCLVWAGGEIEDFELEFEYNISAGGNSGLQYRSQLIDPAKFVMSGYQAEIDGSREFTGGNYEEKGRRTLAERGQRVITIDTANPKRFESIGASTELAREIKANDWNHCRVVAVGNRLSHYINSQLMSEVIDNDPTKATRQGLIGFQLHRGAPMQVQFRNVRLRRLNAAPLANSVSAAAKPTGFVPLFNGQDFSGWKFNTDVAETWKIVNGNLVGTGKSASIETVRTDYKNFELEAEVMLRDVNSGLYFGGTDGFECELCIPSYPTEPALGSILLNGETSKRTNPRVHDRVAVDNAQWMQLRLRSNGTIITVHINERLVCEGDVGLPIQSGPIGFSQWSDTGSIEIRQLRIREF